MIALYSSGASFLIAPPRSSTQVLISSHLPRHELLHRGAGARDGGDRKRRLPHVVWADFGERRQTASRGQKPRRIGMPARENIVAQLERHLAEVAAHGLTGGDAEIREAAHVIEDVLARVVLRAARQVLHVADVRVRIDQGRE